MLPVQISKAVTEAGKHSSEDRSKSANPSGYLLLRPKPSVQKPRRYPLHSRAVGSTAIGKPSPSLNRTHRPTESYLASASNRGAMPRRKESNRTKRTWLNAAQFGGDSTPMMRGCATSVNELVVCQFNPESGQKTSVISDDRYQCPGNSKHGGFPVDILF
jgi:hypothetical protein